MIRKYIFIIIILSIYCLRNNCYSQAVIKNHDINLGPDIPFCDVSTYNFNPFILNPQISTSTSYTQASIPYLPDSYTTGTVLNGLNDDCFSNNLPIGFDFYFFGVSYNYYRMSTNAIITPSNPPQNATAANFPQGGGCSGSVTGCEGNYSWMLSQLGSLGQANNTLPKNSIFFGGIDLLPTTGGQIRYQITGTAPFRKLTIKFKDVPYFSCTTQLFNGQLMLYETTNVIEVHIQKKQTCAWNGNLGVIGVQGQFTNQFCSPAGFNNQSFQFNTSKAWRFTPAGTVPPPATLPITIKWKKLPNGPVTYGQSIAINTTVGVSECYTAEIVRNNSSHTALGCGSNPSPDTVCFYPSYITTAATSSNLNCFGDCNATATVNAIFGFNPWDYTIVNEATGAVITSITNTTSTTFATSGLCAGDYIITSTDSLGCSKNDTVSVISPSEINFTHTKTNISCYGNLTGALVFAAPTGGTAPYLFSINGVQFSSNQNFSGLPAGIYTLYVKDANNCIKTVLDTIYQPTLLTIASSQTNVSCFGNSTGIINLAANGGTPPYLFSCNGNTNNSGSFQSLIAGTYNCNVQDNQGCVSTAQITITQPTAPLNQVVVSQNPVSCFGGNDGNLFAAASGGTPPYSYSIISGANLNNTPVVTSGVAAFSNLLASSNNNVSVVDANGCSIVTSTIITQPTVLNLIVDSVIAVDCLGNATGKICVKGTGAMSPYTFNLSNAAGYSNVANGVINNCFDNLLSNNYNVIITDANGCSETQNIIVTEPPVALNFSINSVSNVLCNGGSSGLADITANGGTLPYQYNISPYTNYQNTLPFSGLMAGMHTIIVKDANGCLAVDSISVSQPLLPLSIATDSVLNVFCNLGNNGCVYTHAITNTGTPPYTYSLSNTGPFSSNSTICALTANNYTVYVKDFNDCIASTDIIITEPQTLLATLTTDSVTCYGGNDGCATMLAVGGTMPYAYYWQNVLGQSVNCGYSKSENNTFKVVDSLGCAYDGIFSIVEPNKIVTTMVDTINLCTNNLILINCNAIGGTPSYTYNWSSSNISNNDTILYKPLLAGVNKVKVFVNDVYGCVSDTDSVLVIVRPEPVAIITTYDTIGCAPFCVKLKDNSYVSNALGDYLVYQNWEFGDGYSSNDTIATHCYKNAETYSVCLTVESNRSCRKKLCRNNLILVHPVPNNDFIMDPIVTNLLEPNVNFVNNKVEMATYTWNFGDGSIGESTNLFPQINHQYEDTGSFHVKLITLSQFGCADTAEHIMLVEPFFVFYVPTAFTPNGDYKNPKFLVKGQALKNFEMQIFDRYGNIIHTQYDTEEANSWDGGTATEGVYNWQITVANPQGKKIQKSGTFNLIR